MSVSKVGRESRTIINVNSDKISEYKIKRILRETDVISKENALLINNQIDIGIYRIHLLLDSRCSNATRLKQYGRFQIRVYEKFSTHIEKINVNKDYRFKGCSWSEQELFCISDLVQVMLHCHKLNFLKVFN